MQELNKFSSVEVFDEEGLDPLTVVDMGEVIALSQADEAGGHHNVIVGLAMARKLRDFLNEILTDVQ